MMTFNEQIQLTRMECGECGCVFAMSEAMREERQRNGGSWFCPNGHSRIYRESDVTRLKRELEQKQAELTAQKCETLRRDQLLANERAAKAKLERRIKHGVCPCCGRTFIRLANHIKHKHPDYGPTQKQKLT